MCFYNVYRCIHDFIYKNENNPCLMILEPDEDNIVYYEFK